MNSCRHHGIPEYLSKTTRPAVTTIRPTIYDSGDPLILTLKNHLVVKIRIMVRCIRLLASQPIFWAAADSCDSFLLCKALYRPHGHVSHTCILYSCMYVKERVACLFGVVFESIKEERTRIHPSSLSATAIAGGMETNSLQIL